MHVYGAYSVRSTRTVQDCDLLTDSGKKKATRGRGMRKVRVR